MQTINISDFINADTDRNAPSYSAYKAGNNGNNKRVVITPVTITWKKSWDSPRFSSCRPIGTTARIGAGSISVRLYRALLKYCRVGDTVYIGYNFLSE
jgi:hypothetical protein